MSNIYNCNNSQKFVVRINENFGDIYKSDNRKKNLTLNLKEIVQQTTTAAISSKTYTKMTYFYLLRINYHKTPEFIK